jgi:membrane protein DedA with SNARE-associated domain
MERALDFIGRHGLPAIFVTVFLGQLGLPIPTPVIVLAFGALAGIRRIDPVAGLLLGILGCLCADILWFRLGRWKGSRVLGFLCRVALEPDSCVSKTHDLFARFGVKSLLVSKFVPGFDTVAPPIAGLLGIGMSRFLLWSGAGAFLWLVTFGGLGYVFSGRIEELASALDQLGSRLGVLVFGVVASYVAWKYIQRQRVLRSIRMARITPDELYQMIVSGQEPTIIDVRSKLALESAPFVIQGAQLLAAEEIDARHSEIPRERDVIVYCS